jgi:hypothetical protein
MSTRTYSPRNPAPLIHKSRSWPFTPVLTKHSNFMRICRSALLSGECLLGKIRQRFAGSRYCQEMLERAFTASDQNQIRSEQ